ncbi:ribonuclease III [Treponema sp.]|uniref:ribonuclease III n=1 Tax=Treponema sp. TaxID=166 RepID=UPI00298DC477|nr:ribonuclease III [Treponema sp.]MCQ2240646.1 ribonuclease III [Treponema sp.]
MSFRDFFYPKKDLTRERRKNLETFCRNLGLHFKDYSILDLAFHHRSYSNENVSHKKYNNERLEFLGDSVLGLATAAFLYNDMENNREGDLAKIKSNVVSEQSLAPIALEKMHIDQYLIMGKGEEMSGGRTKKAILADAVEAVIGALYIDQGYEAAEKLVLDLIVPEIRKVQSNTGYKDYKTMLQEYYQKKSGKCPVYKLEKTTGPDHDRVFYTSVSLGDVLYGPAAGKNKKESEQNVAKEALKILGLAVS